MSEQGRTPTVNAENVEEQAALWIERRDRSDWSVEGQSELDAWLAQSLTHTIAFWRLNAAWKRTERLAALRPNRSKLGGLFDFNRLKPPVVMRVAAMAALIALLGAGVFYLNTPTDRSYVTPIGGREILSLADGSQIELNTDTALRISGEVGERKVWLDRGEAFFQVKHDASHPFTVVVGGQRVTDLGTKFSIRTDRQETEIALTEGSIRLESMSAPKTRAPLTLTPGDVAIATANTVSVTKRPEHVLANELGWRRGVLIFSDTTLLDAAQQFNRYSEHRLVVEASAADLKVDGTFPATDTAAFAAIAEHILHLHIRDNGREIVISRQQGNGLGRHRGGNK